MISKIIHYCWFGGKPLPDLALKCISSWKEYLPNYEIKEWNEQNFDVKMVPYIAEAYQAKKYAFVSDYARFWILYHYGGLYFDTDVELIRPMDDIINHGAFMGCENEPEGATAQAVASGLGLRCNPGLGLGCNPGLSFYSEMIELYSKQYFQKPDGKLNLKTVVEYTTELLVKHGLKNINKIQLVADIYIYPSEYFCPINLVTKRLQVTDKTYTIHHYAGSWVDKTLVTKLKDRIRKCLPNSWLLYYNKWKVGILKR